MLTGRDDRPTPPRRRLRMLSFGPSLITVLAFLAASTAAFTASAHAYTAPENDGESLVVASDQIAGHQPGHARVAQADQADAPQQRAVPWTMDSLAPSPAGFAAPADLVEPVTVPVTSRGAVDVTTAQGRAPPR